MLSLDLLIVFFFKYITICSQAAGPVLEACCPTLYVSGPRSSLCCTLCSFHPSHILTPQPIVRTLAVSRPRVPGCRPLLHPLSSPRPRLACGPELQLQLQLQHGRFQVDRSFRASVDDGVRASAHAHSPIQQGGGGHSHVSGGGRGDNPWPPSTYHEG